MAGSRLWGREDSPVEGVAEAAPWPGTASPRSDRGGGTKGRETCPYPVPIPLRPPLRGGAPGGPTPRLAWCPRVTPFPVAAGLESGTSPHFPGAKSVCCGFLRLEKKKKSPRNGKSCFLELNGAAVPAVQARTEPSQHPPLRLLWQGTCVAPTGLKTDG